MSESTLSPTLYRLMVTHNGGNDPHSVALSQDASSVGYPDIKVICSELYLLSGMFKPLELERFSKALLMDPVIDTLVVSQVNIRSGSTDGSPDKPQVIEVCLKPGVTDTVGDQIFRAAQKFGLQELEQVATGQHFLIHGDQLTLQDYHLLAERLLSNPVIQRYALGEIDPQFSSTLPGKGEVGTVAICGLDAMQLQELSIERRAALNVEEMQAIQHYFTSLNREPSDIEFEMIAQTWSEHCVHKTFKARIQVNGKQPFTIDNLFKETIQAATRQIGAPWVRSAFVDNAGIIEYDGVHELSFKVETHNHPSAIEPFGGANTGTGGVIRDVIGVSARPIASTDVLCFGPAETTFQDLPAGVLHPRRIASGVVSGIQDYGNKLGVPTVNGAIYYDSGYIANPLVFCGCLGIAPVDSHPNQICAGDRIVVIGGRTGRDGLRGATFSSMTMDAKTGEVCGASVQIGSPLVEKGVIDVVMAARDRQLYHAITDCGAGGLSSAVGEMGSQGGATVQLEKVPLKYAGLAPWEIWLSEAQERMVLAIPPLKLADMQHLCNLYEVEMTDIGEFTETGNLTVFYENEQILKLDNHFLFDGLPQRSLQATLCPPLFAPGKAGELFLPSDFHFQTCLQDLLSHPNIASKENIIRVYDHEVQGATVLKPLVGVENDGPADACVLRPLETQGELAITLSVGINPEYGKLDAGQMAANVIDEAIRNAVSVGADPHRIAILDNFCWGDPGNPETLGKLVAAALTCRDTAVAFGTPFISGKDSFNNEYLGSDGKRHAIPPTLLVSAVGIMPDWRKVVTLDLKASGDHLYLVGLFQPVLGGSHLNLLYPDISHDGIPACQTDLIMPHYIQYHQAIQSGLIQACHDLSEGGLAVCAAEMCIAGRLGMQLHLSGGNLVRRLFGETCGCLLVEVKEKHSSAFEACFQGLNCQKIGKVVENPVFQVDLDGQVVIDAMVNDLTHKWKGQIGL